MSIWIQEKWSLYKSTSIYNSWNVFCFWLLSFSEVRGVFLDLSKAFDKVWHDGLIYKLKSLGISGSLLKIIQNYFDNRFQRVLSNGQTSEWKSVKAGIPHGSVLGPLFFWFILMIFAVIYQLMLNSSLMILIFSL